VRIYISKQKKEQVVPDEKIVASNQRNKTYFSNKKKTFEIDYH
jgi:hypothetical protein